MYCITHGHDNLDWASDECILASCPPPLLEDDWEMHITEPSPEELALMDAEADLLLADLDV